MILLMSSTSYSQSLIDDSTVHYLQIAHETNYEEDTFTREYEALLIPRLAFKAENILGYIELKNKLNGYTESFAGYKIKLKSTTYNLATKAYGRTNGELSKFSLIHTLKASWSDQLEAEFESEVVVKLPSKSSRLLVSPIVNWSQSYRSHSISFAIKPVFFLFPCQCPNGKSYYSKEAKIEWNYDFALSEKARLGIGAELAKKFISGRTERKWLLSVRYYL